MILRLQCRYGGNKHAAKLITLSGKITEIAPVDTVGIKKKIQPVITFVAFLEGDLQLGNEIFCALSKLSFVNICSDRSAATQKLIDLNRFDPVIAHLATGECDLFCEIGGFLTQDAFCHGDDLEGSIE